jgi:hypothetical protein
MVTCSLAKRLKIRDSNTRLEVLRPAVLRIVCESGSPTNENLTSSNAGNEAIMQ